MTYDEMVEKDARWYGLPCWVSCWTYQGHERIDLSGARGFLQAAPTRMTLDEQEVLASVGAAEPDVPCGQFVYVLAGGTVEEKTCALRRGHRGACE